MKNPNIEFDRDKIKSFFSENKGMIATIGGVAAGLAIISFLGKERSAKLLTALGTSVKAISGTVLKDLGGFKDLLSPILSKISTQGL
jgi:hypothetical protein